MTTNNEDSQCPQCPHCPQCQVSLRECVPLWVRTGQESILCFCGKRFYGTQAPQQGIETENRPEVSPEQTSPSGGTAKRRQSPQSNDPTTREAVASFVCAVRYSRACDAFAESEAMASVRLVSATSVAIRAGELGYVSDGCSVRTNRQHEPYSARPAPPRNPADEFALTCLTIAQNRVCEAIAQDMHGNYPVQTNLLGRNAKLTLEQRLALALAEPETLANWHRMVESGDVRNATAGMSVLGRNVLVDSALAFAAARAKFVA